MPRVAGHAAVGRFRPSGPIASFLESANASDEPVGSASMTVLAIIQQNRVYSGNGETVFTHSNTISSQNGWQLIRNNVGFSFDLADGIPARRVITVSPAVSPAIGTIYFHWGSYNETLQIVRAMGENNTQGPFTGFTPSSTRPLAVGVRATGNDLHMSSASVIGLIASNAQALTIAEMASAEASLKNDLEEGRLFDTSFLAMPYYWDARDIDYINGTWINRAGPSSTTLNITGKLEPYEADGMAFP
jgi:hypothetical protein